MAYGGGKSAVDAILAEAADLVALEQIARLNTAHLDDSAALPSSLESRFRKLKSLPAAAPLPPPAKSLGRSVTAPPQHRDDPPADSPPQANPPAPAPEAAPKEENSPPQPHHHPSNPAVPAVREDDENEDDLERLFGPRRGRPTLKERNRRTDSSSSRSPPPPRQACCFPFSPKKALQKTPATRSSKKKTHAEGYTDDVLGVDAGEWGDENRRMAMELKEQQRKMKKALEEQVKVSRETAKMARWVKQASARMTHTDAIDDLLSDLDDEDELK
jgi:pyruvate/2-oxoglutarate dehydrogenase complex dihydrolipoamide acyltransferase (E2) component